MGFCRSGWALSRFVYFFRQNPNKLFSKPCPKLNQKSLNLNQFAPVLNFLENFYSLLFLFFFISERKHFFSNLVSFAKSNVPFFLDSLFSKLINSAKHLIAQKKTNSN